MQRVPKAWQAFKKARSYLVHNPSPDALASFRKASQELMEATGTDNIMAASLAAQLWTPQFGIHVPEPERQERTDVPPAERIRQIEEELDIIRGVAPTPRGYRIDKAKIKELNRELRELQSKT